MTPKLVWKPRYILPETIHVGDVIRITTKRDDIERTTVGKVASREHEGAATVLRTEAGHEIIRYIHENARSFKVTLLDPAPTRFAPIEPLFKL